MSNKEPESVDEIKNVVSFEIAGTLLFSLFEKSFDKEKINKHATEISGNDGENEKGVFDFWINFSKKAIENPNEENIAKLRKFLGKAQASINLDTKVGGDRKNNIKNLVNCLNQLYSYLRKSSTKTRREKLQANLKEYYNLQKKYLKKENIPFYESLFEKKLDGAEENTWNTLLKKIYYNGMAFTVSNFSKIIIFLFIFLTTRYFDKYVFQNKIYTKTNFLLTKKTLKNSTNNLEKKIIALNQR